MTKTLTLSLVLLAGIATSLQAQQSPRTASNPLPGSVFASPSQFLKQESGESGTAGLGSLNDSAQEDGTAETPEIPSIRGLPNIQAMSLAMSNQESESVTNSFFRYASGASVANHLRMNSASHTKTWHSPNSLSRPLYFEDANVERYGNYHPRWQPAISGIRFVKDTLTMPYQLAAQHPNDCVYSLGHFRPGDCNPAYKPEFRLNKRAAAINTLFTAGLLLGL